jgi:ribose transport system substrate-binding protein
MRKICPALLALLVACSPTSREPAKAKPAFKIAVIPQGATHEFWKSIHAGAIKAAEDLKAQGVEITLIWKAPLREDDREQQVQVVEGFLAQGISGIVLAPFDRRALVRPVEEAKRAGIPTVVLDSGLDSDQVVSFLASDNHHGGELAADRMAKLLNGKGKVLLLRYQEGVASTEAREQGFVDRIKTYPGVELISSDQYAGGTRDTAKTAAENLLNRYGDQIQGIFTPNESSTSGTLLALEDVKRAGKITFIGFDTSDAFIAAMRAGTLQGIVVQNPFRMGELGVRTMVDHLQGKPVEKKVDTGVELISPETLDAPESQKLLHPPLAKYLGAGPGGL